MADTVDHQLTDAEAAVLLSLSAEAAAAAAPAGAGAGGRLGARLTRARTAMRVVDVPTDLGAARQAVVAAISGSGTLIDDPNVAGDGSIWGVVASGALNLVPALVRVSLEPTAGGVRVEVRATGREGLIKQRIGAKAADRIAERLTG